MSSPHDDDPVHRGRTAARTYYQAHHETIRNKRSMRRLRLKYKATVDRIVEIAMRDDKEPLSGYTERWKAHPNPLVVAFVGFNGSHDKFVIMKGLEGWDDEIKHCMVQWFCRPEFVLPFLKKWDAANASGQSIADCIDELVKVQEDMDAQQTAWNSRRASLDREIFDVLTSI